MKKVDKCLVCGSTNLLKKKSVLSDFVALRIHRELPPPETNLCLCRDCTFGFYEDRLSDEENGWLYDGYRGDEYQKLRESCEPYYTEELNEKLNNDQEYLEEQKRIIVGIIKKNINKELKIALDYGGNEGRTFTDVIGTKEKYVYDISGVPTIEGVIGIDNEDELKKHNYDFIMCNQVFEHLSYPLDTLTHLKEIGGDDTYYYIEVPSQSPFFAKPNLLHKKISLIPDKLYLFLSKLYHSLKGEKSYFVPLTEHVNFYTVKSIRTMVENNGFKVLDIQENEEHNVLGSTVVLSILFKKNS